jgi:EF hand
MADLGRVALEDPTIAERALTRAFWRLSRKGARGPGSVRRRSRTASILSFGPSGCLAVAIALGAVGTAAGQQADDSMAPGFYERFAFDAADTDGDGFVSEAELARDAAAGFSGLDVDRSETLAPDELGPHDPAQFGKVDANGDGALTFSEVMAHKTRAFEEADGDQDGLLSFEDMVDAVQAELGDQG